MIDNILGYEIYSLEDLVFVVGFPLSIVIGCVALIVAFICWCKSYKLRKKEYHMQELMLAQMSRTRGHIERLVNKK